VLVLAWELEVEHRRDNRIGVPNLQKQMTALMRSLVGVVMGARQRAAGGSVTMLAEEVVCAVEALVERSSDRERLASRTPTIVNLLIHKLRVQFWPRETVGETMLCFHVQNTFLCDFSSPYCRVVGTAIRRSRNESNGEE